MDFSRWLNLQFVGWQLQQGARQTEKQFAEYLGINLATLSQWMLGKARPQQHFVDLLASKLGADVYNVLGLHGKDPLLLRLEAIWEQLPPEAKVKIADVVNKSKLRE